MEASNTEAVYRNNGHASIFIKGIALWLISQVFVYEYLWPGMTFDLGVRLTPDRLIFVFLALAFCFSSRVRGARHFTLETAETLMALFAFYCFISLFVGGADANVGNHRWLTTLINFVIFPFFAYIVAKQVRFSIVDWKLLISVMSVLALYLSFTAFAEHYRWRGLVWPDYINDREVGNQFGRSRGPFANSGNMGRALIACYCCLSIKALYAAGWRRMLVYLLIGLTAGAVYFTNTRAIWIAFALCLLSFLLFKSPIRRLTMFIVSIGMIVAVSGGASKLALGDSNTFSHRQNTIEYRLENYKVAAAAVLENPVFGIGYGNLNPYLFRLTELGKTENRLRDGNHNTFLGLFAELGIVGMLLFGGLLAVMLSSCVRTFRALAGSHMVERACAVAAICLMITFLFTGNFADLRFQSFLPTLLFLFFGFVKGIEWELREGWIDHKKSIRSVRSTRVASAVVG